MTRPLRVLVACEESQTVTCAFRALGHDAYSNDLVECSGGYPDWHLQCDAFEAIGFRSWDLNWALRLGAMAQQWTEALQ